MASMPSSESSMRSSGRLQGRVTALGDRTVRVDVTEGVGIDIAFEPRDVAGVVAVLSLSGRRWLTG
jgi:hypothetical protein